MGNEFIGGSDDGGAQYYRTKESDNNDSIWFILGIMGLGAAAAGIFLNKDFFNSIDVGRGRILNNYFHRIEPYQDLSEKDLYFQRQYRTHNVAYPDILYENLPYKQKFPKQLVKPSGPQPVSEVTRTQLTYAEPSNIVTDNIIYEDGVPDIREDYRITGEIPGVGKGSGAHRWTKRGAGGIDAGGKNIVFTTEYAPGLNEKVRRDNPVVVTDIPTPTGKTVKRINRLAPADIPSRSKRRFNKDYDESGNPIVTHDPVYDTIDWLQDLDLSRGVYGYGEVGSKISDETLKVYEDFLIKGRLREGYEIIPEE